MELLPFYFLTLARIISCLEEPPVTKMRVKEDEDVILPCSLDSTNIRSDTFDWKKDDQKEVFLYSAGSHYNNGRTGQDPQFKGRVFHFEDQLQSGNASIVIRNTKVTDSGRYSCIFPFHKPTTRSIIELIVDRVLKDRTQEKKIQGSAPEPCVTRLHQTPDHALLQCEVQGALPEPKVEWVDSSGNTVPSQKKEVSERGGRYYVTVQTTVTKTDNFSCVATQEEISHRISTATYVHLYASQPSVRILEQTNEGVLLQCVVRGAFPKPKVVWKDGAGNILPAKEPEETENEGSYNITLNVTVTKNDFYRCVSTQEDLYKEIDITVHEFPNGLLVAVALFSAVFVVVLLILVVMKCYIMLKSFKALKFPADDDHEAEAMQSTQAQELPTGLLVAAVVSGALLIILLFAIFANKTCTRLNCSTVSESSTGLIAVVAVLVSLLVVLFIAYWCCCWMRNRSQRGRGANSEKSVDRQSPGNKTSSPSEEIPLNHIISH